MFHSSLQPLISVSEARKLLGKQSKILSDTQVLELIYDIQIIARKYLQGIGSKKYDGNMYQEKFDEG